MSISIRMNYPDSNIGRGKKEASFVFEIKNVPLNTITSAVMRWTRKPPAVDFPTEWSVIPSTLLSTIRKISYPGRDYGRATGYLTLPDNGYYYISAVITTSTGQTYTSDSVELDFAYRPRLVNNLRVTRNNNIITLSWNPPTTGNGYLPIYGYRIDCKIDDVIYTVNTQGGVTDFTGLGTASSYTINLNNSSLPQNKIYSFRLTLFDTAFQSIERWFPKIFIGNNNTNNQLFDKTSWANAAPATKRYLDIAADMWANYIKFDPRVLSEIYKIKPGFKGIRLNSVRYIYNQNATEAKCGPAEYVDIGTKTDVKFNTLSFNLEINRYFFDLNPPPEYGIDSYWLKAFIHELGHALGIGSFYWKQHPVSSEPWINNQSQLIGKYFPNTLSAYIRINQFRKQGWKRSIIPLNFEGRGKDSHWAHIRNPLNRGTFLHPPIPEDIMSYGWGAANISQLALIGLVSIKNLVDLGYQEVNPGSFEQPAAPQNQSLSSNILSETQEVFTCGGSFDDEYQPVKVATLDLVQKQVIYAPDVIIPTLESES